MRYQSRKFEHSRNAFFHGAGLHPQAGDHIKDRPERELFPSSCGLAYCDFVGADWSGQGVADYFSNGKAEECWPVPGGISGCLHRPIRRGYWLRRSGLGGVADAKLVTKADGKAAVFTPRPARAADFKEFRQD